MPTIKTFKPYYVKDDGDHIRVVLAYQYFSIVINEIVYHFVPLEAREIRINRITQKVENKNDIFVFQNGKKYESISVANLMRIKDFQLHLASILSPYMVLTKMDVTHDEINAVIMELEKSNIHRLIDQALDEKNEADFLKYTELLKNM
ncbi:ERCC4-related helicase [Gracilibacillus halotolerans]|uniref:ERCC4-related helicase n=1 Tax=Gracilibacillus halotolerans TaxID=74386 RepID=A0A841RNM8_9BACI|nr:IDEAL domain-containing protein [Gracilibacillus halotolerans]MBB6512268.1 ERCC4-related helicase [Gracilibacillus halotolerans]